jgi:hypothetical protein
MPEPTAPAPARKLEKDHVEVRVMKLGHDKIHTGDAVDGIDEKFKQGDKFAVHKDIAEAHEDKGWVEIL